MVGALVGFTGGCGGGSSSANDATGGGSTGGSVGGAGGGDPGGAGANGTDGGTTSCSDLPATAAPVGSTVDFVGGVTVSTLAGSGVPGTSDGAGATVGLSNPVSVAVGPDGNIFVAEYDDNQIRSISAAGASSTVIPNGSLGQPFGLVAAGAGVLYVDTDRNPQGDKSSTTGTVWRIDVASKAATVVGADLGRPRGIAVLPDGRLALSDYKNHRVMLLDPQTSAVTQLAGNGCPGYADGQGTSAQFNTPYGIAVRPDGTLVVADWGNQRLRTVGLDGTVGTLAGSGDPGMIDGDAAQARFYFPEDVAVDASGAVYVSDEGNHRIRRLAAGRVQTLAGDGNKGFGDGPGSAAEFYGQEGLDVTSDGGTVYVADGTGGDIAPYHRVRAIAVPASTAH